MTLLPADKPGELPCGECGNNLPQETALSSCEICGRAFCRYDCAMRHQERTGHYLTHIIS